MAVLTVEQRNILEKVVIKARNTAEEGAVNSLKTWQLTSPSLFRTKHLNNVPCGIISGQRLVCWVT
jgi:hypothetical protein